MGNGQDDGLRVPLRAKNTVDLAALPPWPAPEGLRAYVDSAGDSGGSDWSWYPTGSNLPAGAVTATGHGGVWVKVTAGAGTGGAWAQLVSSPSGAVAWTGATGDTFILNNHLTPYALTINDQGDIGIGELLPSDPTHHLSFEIMRSQNTDAASTIRNRNDGASARAVWHGFCGSGDQVDASISIASVAGGGYVNWRAGGTTGGFNLLQSSNDFMAFYTNNISRMRLTAAGALNWGPNLISFGNWLGAANYGGIWFGVDAAAQASNNPGIAYDGSAANGGSGTMVVGDGATSVAIASTYCRASSDLGSGLGLSTVRWNELDVQNVRIDSTGVGGGQQAAGQCFTFQPQSYVVPAGGGSQSTTSYQPLVILTGVLNAGATYTLDLGNNVGMWWIDVSGLTVQVSGPATLAIKSGSTTIAISITGGLPSTANLITAHTNGANGVALGS